MRTTAFVAVPRPHVSQSDVNPANKLFRSLSWERTLLTFLAKVEALPLNLKAEIAIRVGTYIECARTARDDATLTHFIEAAAGERERIAGDVRFAANPLWTAAALAESWCVTRLGLSNGTLNRYSAMSVLIALETFASDQAS